MKYDWSQPVGRLVVAARVDSWTWIRYAILTLLGAAAAACALLAQHRSDPARVPAWVIVVSLLAVTAAAVMPTAIINEPSRLDYRVTHLKRVGLYSACLLAPLVVAVGLWNREPFQVSNTFMYVSSTLAALLWLAGLIGALALIWIGDNHARGLFEPKPAASVTLFRNRAFQAELVAFGAIVVLAAALRLWHLGTLPEGVWWDEADGAQSDVQLMHLPFQPFATVGHNPSLYYYVMAALMAIGGNTITVVRLTSALFGVLAVVAVYALGRQVGGATLGLVSAMLMAIAQWAIDFSRLGMPNIAAPASLSIAFAIFTRAMFRPRAFWFALSGVSLGVALLTYEGGYLAAAVALAVLAWRALTDRPFGRVAWPAMLLVPVGFLAGAAPLLFMLLKFPDYTLARITTVSLFHEYPSWSQLIPALGENLRRHLLMLTVAGDNNGRHNLPGAPMLDPITGACLLLGLGICIRRIHRWFFQLLLLWLIVGMLGGILSLDWEAPQGARTVAAIAPITLIAALPLALLAHTVWTGIVSGLTGAMRRRVSRAALQSSLKIGQQGQAAIRAVGVALAAVVMAIPLTIAYAHDANQYFVRQASDPSSWAASGGTVTIVGRAIAPLMKRGYTVLLDPSQAGDLALVYAAGGIQSPPYDPSVPVPPTVPPGGLALIIPIDNVDTFNRVRSSYPEARVIPLTPNFDHTNVQANIVLITAADVARSVGVDVIFSAGTRRQTLSHMHAIIPWPSGATSTTTATIKGTLVVAAAQAGQPIVLRVRGARQVGIMLNGEPLSAPALPVRLGAGNNALTITARGKASAALELQWRVAGIWSDIPIASLGAPTLPTGGLLGEYYNAPAIQGSPVLWRVDPTVNTYYQAPPTGLGFPFSARWIGTLKIPRQGRYTFALDSTGPSHLFLDDKSVAAAQPGNNASGTVVLRPGRHRLRLEYSATGGYLHCYLTWAPPGQGLAPIPPEFTDPAHG